MISMSPESQTLETVIRRASTVKAELALFTSAEYPPETIQLRGVISTLVNYISDVLESIKHSPTSPETSLQVQQLGRSLHELYAMVRFLRDSASLSTPPALQAVVSFLVSKYSSARKLLTIVRPQWEYNCEFINLSYELSQITVGRLPALAAGGRHLLDEPGLVVRDVVAKTPDVIKASQAILDMMRRREKQRDGMESQPRVPHYIGVLSLAGIEKHDVYLYPMMAHEVAHAIAYSRPIPAHYPVTARIAYGRTKLERALKRSKRSFALSELATWDEIVTRRIEICVRELLADLIATRMLGVGYFFGLASFLGGLYQWSDPLLAPGSSYPSMRLRLKLCLEELISLPDIEQTLAAAENRRARRTLDPSSLHLARMLGDWTSRLGDELKELPDPPPTADDEDYLLMLSTNAVIHKRALIVDAARRIVPDAGTSVTSSLQHRTAHLDHRLPPLLANDAEGAIPEIFTAAWVHRSLSRPTGTPEYDRRNRLLTKAIELATSPRPESKPAKKTMEPKTISQGVFSGDVLAVRAKLRITDRRRLAIVPLDLSTIAAASLDVHLGNWFKLSRRPKVASIDISHAKDFLKTGVLHDEFFVKTGEALILHAGDFALGITQEFFGMPDDAMAFVEGKSSIGRTGLIVATATQVAPGFHGCIVLELANTGTVPLEIKPGMEIAQLVVIGTSAIVSKELLYSGDYDCQIRP